MPLYPYPSDLDVLRMAHYTAADHPLEPIEPEWAPELDPDDLRELQEAQDDPSKIISKLPSEDVRLGYFSSICLIFNRMIGTGIFNSASVVFANTQLIGASLLLWVYGAAFALCGVIMYTELGLSIPRWPFGPNGEKIATPRSGDAMNYLNYFLKRPMFLATCLFGVTFILLENTAPNSIAFAQNILDAAQTPATPGKIIAIAVAANTVCCLLHSMSRKWGILLNNFLGVLKFFILVFVIIIGLVWINKDVAGANYSPSTSFNAPPGQSKLPYRYAEAIIYVMYPYGGFHQINYVISELKQPRKVFPRSSCWGVLTVATLYTAVNITYAAIIPKEDLFQPGGIDVGMRFFELTIGKVFGGYKTFFSILKSISAFGNLVVVTFTAARVKQEIAKEGILPYSLWFASSYDFSLRRLLCLQKPTTPSNHSSFKPSPFSSEKTPAATLLLHWLVTNLMVVGPVLALQPTPYASGPAFTFLSGSYAYLINIVTFTFVSFGFLFFRFSAPQRWDQKSAFAKKPFFYHISTLAGMVVFLSCMFPLIAIWIPDPAMPNLARTAGLVPWWGAVTFAIGLLAFAAIYWMFFRLYIVVRSAREGKTLYVLREPKFKVEMDDRRSSGMNLTQTFEIVTLQWVRDVGMTMDELRSVSRLGGLGGVDTTSRGGIGAGWTSGSAGQMSALIQQPQEYPLQPGIQVFVGHRDDAVNKSVTELAVTDIAPPVVGVGPGVVAYAPVIQPQPQTQSHLQTQVAYVSGSPSGTSATPGPTESPSTTWSTAVASSLRSRGPTGLRPQELE